MKWKITFKHLETQGIFVTVEVEAETDLGAMSKASSRLRNWVGQSALYMIVGREVIK